MREAEAAWVRALPTERPEGTLSGVAEWRDLHETGGVTAEFTQMPAEGGMSTD